MPEEFKDVKDIGQDLTFDPSGNRLPGRNKVRNIRLQMVAGEAEYDFSSSGVRFASSDDYTIRIDLPKPNAEGNIYPHSYYVAEQTGTSFKIKNADSNANSDENIVPVAITEVVGRS